MPATPSNPTFRDPWPTGQPTWGYPPWRLSGRVVTAWFELPRAAIARMLSPDLMTDGDSMRVRLRFYDLEFAASGPERAAAPVLPDGRFKEAALGVPSRVGDVVADTSVSLWSDSVTYVMWGREAYGWPVLPADVTLEGELWSRPVAPGLTGSAAMADGFGRALLERVRVGEPADAPSGSPTWITPRRVLEHPPAGERRDVLLVRPAVVQAGERHLGTGEVELDFPAGHPYSIEGRHSAEVEVVDGIELLVADDVTVVDTPQRPAA